MTRTRLEVARRRVRRALRPPRSLRITSTGRTYLVLTVGVGIGALNTGNNLLYLVLGLLLSMVVVSGVLSERCLRDLEVRRVGAEAPFAAEPFAFRWVVSKKRGHAFALSFTETAAGLSGLGVLAHLRAGGEPVPVRADLIAARRGPFTLEGVRVTTTYPLGLFAKSRVFELPDTLLVFPRRSGNPRQPQAPQAGLLGESAAPLRAGGSGDLLGLRELDPTADSRRVHWLKSASAAKLLEVEREREERRTVTLQVHGGLAGEPLDRRCEDVAAQAHALFSQGYEVGLETPAQRLRPASGGAHELRLLRALALVGFAR